jgi:two-component system cell cycle sensor histidine kinase/response regulator CckA
LVLTDVVMSGMSGRQGASHPAPCDEGLFLSGEADDAVVRLGALEAESAFLQKPFTPVALANKVREVLDES